MSKKCLRPKVSNGVKRELDSYGKQRGWAKKLELNNHILNWFLGAAEELEHVKAHGFMVQSRENPRQSWWISKDHSDAVKRLAKNYCVSETVVTYTAIMRFWLLHVKSDSAS